MVPVFLICSSDCLISTAQWSRFPRLAESCRFLRRATERTTATVYWKQDQHSESSEGIINGSSSLPKSWVEIWRSGMYILTNSCIDGECSCRSHIHASRALALEFDCLRLPKIAQYCSVKTYSMGKLIKCFNCVLPGSHSVYVCWRTLSIFKNCQVMKTCIFVISLVVITFLYSAYYMFYHPVCCIDCLVSYYFICRSIIDNVVCSILH